MQAVLCFATKRELEESIAAEETSPSQPISDTSFMDEVIEGIKNLAAGIANLQP
jgi:hypothetical protein